MAKSTENERVRFDVLDIAWITQVARSFGERQRAPVKPRFDHASAILANIREQLGFKPTQGIYAPLPVDMRRISTPGTGVYEFVQDLKNGGIIPLPIDYREAYGSVPHSYEKTSANTTFQHLDALISYMIGVAVGRCTKTVTPEILIVSGSFDLYRPLLNATAKGQASLAFFDGHLDGRWVRLAKILTTGESPVKFVKLNVEEWFTTGVPAEKQSDIGDLLSF